MGAFQWDSELVDIQNESAAVNIVGVGLHTERFCRHAERFGSVRGQIDRVQVRTFRGEKTSLPHATGA